MQKKEKEHIQYGDAKNNCFVLSVVKKINYPIELGIKHKQISFLRNLDHELHTML